jgi:hypothetical protein
MSGADFVRMYSAIYDRTEATYAKLGHPLGFNPFIVSSVRAFEASPRLLLMGLNPAGSKDYPEHRGRFRYEEDDSYIGTSWGDLPKGQAKLQKQIALLLKEVQRRVGDKGPLDRFALNRIVSGNFVPFRSRNWGDLYRKEESIAFGQSLWGEVFSAWRPQYVVTFGAGALDAVIGLLGDVHEARDYDPRWQGSLSIRVLKDGTRLLGLPHLSRFMIFGRLESMPAITEALDDLFAGAPR